MNTKKEINISRKLIISILASISLSIFTVFLIHFFGKWSAFYKIPDSVIKSSYGIVYSKFDDPLSSYDVTCMFGNQHITWCGDEEVKGDAILHEAISVPKLKTVIKITFVEHWISILLISLVYLSIILIFQKFKLNIK